MIRSRSARALAAAVAAAALAELLVATGLLTPLERRAGDWRQRALATAAPENVPIRLLAVDDATLALGREIGALGSPIRAYLGAAVAFCRAAGARALLLADEMRDPSAWGADDDRELAEQLRAGGMPVVLTVAASVAGAETRWPDGVAEPPFRLDVAAARQRRPYPQWTAATLDFPVDPLAHAAPLLGAVTDPRDADGRVRRLRPVLVFDDETVLPALALAAFAAVTGERAGEVATVLLDERALTVGATRLPLDGDGRAVLRFRRAPAGARYRYPAESAARAIEAGLGHAMTAGAGALDVTLAARYRNAFVVLGTPRRVETPLGPATSLEVHATVLDNLLEGRFLRVPSSSARVLATLAVSLLAAFAAAAPRRRYRFLAVPVLAMPVALGALAFELGRAWPIVAPTLAAVLAAAAALTLARRPMGKASPILHPEGARAGGDPAGVDTFDVFLSHNGSDRETVTALAEALRERGLRPWLDRWQLVPGRPWQDALEEVIAAVPCAAVLIGRDGLGPWERVEMRACLREMVERGAVVIPVLLPGAPATPELPLFLRQLTWVDLRGGLTDPGIDRLVWGITIPRRVP